MQKLITKIFKDRIKEENEEFEYRSKKIGSFIFFVEKNDMNLLSVSRRSGVTEIIFNDCQAVRGGDQHFFYHLTDEQHEDFITNLGIEFEDTITSKGEI